MPDYKLRIIVEGQDRASGPLRGVAGSLGRIAEFTAGNLLATGFEKVFSGAANLAGGLARVTGEAADLNALLSETAALSGATSGEIGTLKDLIYDLGIDPSLKVTTTEAAEAVNMLVRNGLSLEEVMEGAARSTVLLANSTGAEFGQAADIATNAMAIFGLEADDMAAAVDGITGVVNNSQFTIQDYNMALAQGGAAASVAGMSLDEFNTGIVAISSNFASGSDAGTSWKTMIQRLVPQTDEASAAMAALGLNFFEADGSMKSVAEIGGELNRVFEGQVNFARQVGGRTAEQNAELQRLNRLYNSTTNSINDYSAGISGANYNDEQRAKKIAELQGKLEAINAERQKLLGIQGDLVTTTRALTEEEKIQYLQTIFGTDAMRAAAALAGYTEEEMSALYDTLQESDAELAAAKRMDNLKGDMEIFGGVIETVRLQIGDRFQPAARAFVQSMTTIAEAAAPAATAAADAISTWIAPYVNAFAGQVQAAVDAAEAAFAEFSPEFGIGPGLVAAAGAAGGAEIDVTANVMEVVWSDTLSYTFDAEANVHTLNWGDTEYVFDAAANIIDIIRPESVFSIDLNAMVSSIDWTSGVTGDNLNYSYDAVAQVSRVFWTPAGGGTFNYVYDAEAGIRRVQWLNAENMGFTYDANARIFDINWTYLGESYGWTYDADAQIIKVNWMGETFDAANAYDALSQIISVEWGNFTHTYVARARVAVVDWLNNTAAAIGDRFGGGGGDEPVRITPGSSIESPGRAIGDASWRGGLVNVHRDELIALPRGSRIYNPSEAAMMAGAGTGVSISNVTINNGMDMAEFEARLQRLLYRRR